MGTRCESEVLFWKRAGCFLLVSAILLCIGCMQPSVPSRRKLVDEGSPIWELMTKTLTKKTFTIGHLTEGIKTGTIIIDNLAKEACLKQAQEILSRKEARKEARAKLSTESVKYAMKIRKFRLLIEALKGLN